MPSRTKKSGDPRKSNIHDDDQSAYREDKYAPSQWGGEIYSDLECPSGQTCQVRRPGTEGLLKAGVLHDLDMLTPIIAGHKDVADGRRPKVTEDQQLAEMVKDPAKVLSLVHMLDRVLTYVVVQPQVEMTPNDRTRRDPKKVYADQVDLDDKLFILNYVVGGSRSLEQFREESEAALGGVQAQLAAEGAA